MKLKLKNLIKRLLKPNTSSSTAFVKYLRKAGVTIGENNHFVNPSSTFIDIGRADYISIGDNNCFSGGAIIAHDYSWYILADKYGEILPDSGGKVSIGNNVFVGYQSVILKGVTIGNNVIIGARSVITSDIPDNCVVAGSPARKIMDIDTYYQKKKNNYLKDVKYRIDLVLEKKGRYPTYEELGFFCLLFLKRTEENYSNYLKSLLFNGKDDSYTVRNIFFNTDPAFKSYDDMIQSLYREEQNPIYE